MRIVAFCQLKGVAVTDPVLICVISISLNLSRFLSSLSYSYLSVNNLLWSGIAFSFLERCEMELDVFVASLDLFFVSMDLEYIFIIKDLVMFLDNV